MSRPCAVGISLGGTRRAGDKRTLWPAAPLTRAQSRDSARQILACALGEGLLRETPPAPGLTARLKSRCEPWRRERHPEEAMSEGARCARTLASLGLRLSDQRRPTGVFGRRAG